MFDRKIRRGIGALVMMILGPIIVIAAYNHFFGLNIPITPMSWFLVFLVSLLAGIVVIALILLSVVGSVVGFVVGKGILGLIILGAALLSIPVVFILSFNFMMKTAVPITGESYLVAGLVMLATAMLSGIVKGPK